MDEQVSYDLGCAKFPAGQPPCSAAIRVYRIHVAALSPASAQARKKLEVSVTISGLRERNKTSQAVFRIGYGPGRGLPLLHAGCRGKAARQRLREKSWRRPCGSICRGHPAATPGIAHHAGARTAV